MSAAEGFTLLFKVWWSCVVAFWAVFFPPKPKDVTGKIVLITGAGSGIGRALSMKFAERKAKLALWDVNKEGNEETATLVRNFGGTAFTYVCDVTKIDSVQNTAKLVRRDLGQVDILVNNAGIMIAKSMLDLEEKDIRKTMEINTISHFWTIKEFLPAMMKSNSGHIVTLSSMAGVAGAPMLVDYCASKFAVFGLAESLAEEMRRYGKTGIRFTTICPMFVNTNLFGELKERMFWKVERGGRMMDPEEVAGHIIDGVLRNYWYVYIPSRFARTFLIKGLLPKKAQHLLTDFNGTGFYYKHEKK